MPAGRPTIALAGRTPSDHHPEPDQRLNGDNDLIGPADPASREDDAELMLDAEAVACQLPGATAEASTDAQTASIRPKADDDVIKSGKLRGMTMWAAIWVLSWPVLLESFMNALVGMVDTTLAASISEPATDAVGAASYFLWFIGLVGMAIGVGATAIIARAMGKGRPAAASAALGQAVLLALACGATVAVVLALSAPTIASILGLTGEARDGAIAYLRILSVGVAPQTVLMMSLAACRGAGDSVSPMWSMAFINLLNVITSFILSGTTFQYASRNAEGVIRTYTLIDNPFPFELGLVGIAWGTVIAWIAGTILLLAVLARGTHGLKLRPRRLKPNRLMARRLIAVGVPNFFETLGMWLGNFVVIMLVGWMASTSMLGTHIVAIRIEAFSFLPGFAMSLAASTLVGQYLGAKRPDLAKRAVARCTTVAAAIMLAFGLAFILVPQAIVGVFSSQPTHLDYVPTLLLICGITQVPFAIGICLRGSMRGAGDTRTVMMLTWFSTYGVRLPLAVLWSGLWIPISGLASDGTPIYTREIPVIGPLLGVEPGRLGLWIALCTEHVIRMLIFLVRFLQGGWSRVRV